MLSSDSMVKLSMLNRIIGIIVAVVALLGAGAFSYTYLEHTIGPRESASVVIHPLAPKQKVATTTAKVTIKTVTKVAVKTNANLVSVTPTKKMVVAPGPLRAPVVQATPVPSSSALTISGVIQYTNIARAQNGGFSALAENATLDLDAKMKLDDMFAKQYFEHVSPSGVGPADLAKTVGYAYIVVGENLALGDFGGDAKLVDAWMASPGHRANILNSHYQEIGVAVGKGMYEGRQTWLAVQSFGMPLSACPAIDMQMKAQIDINNANIVVLKTELDAKKVKLDNTPTNDPNYNTYVNDYNILIPPYNTLVQDTKALIETYNTGVRAYNDCLAVAGTH